MELTLPETIPGTEPQQPQGRPCQTPRAPALHPLQRHRRGGLGRDSSCLLTCHHLEGGEVDVVLGHLLEQLIWGQKEEGRCGCPPARHSPSPAEPGHGPSEQQLTHALARFTGGLEEVCFDL